MSKNYDIIVKNFRLPYHIDKGIEGFVYVQPHKTQKEADHADANMNEPWGEPSSGNIRIKIEDNRLYYCDSAYFDEDGNIVDHHNKNLNYEKYKYKEFWVEIVCEEDRTSKRRFKFNDGHSNKFWEVEQNENELTTYWGRIGTDGQSNTKTLADFESAAEEVNKLVREKTAKGYKEI